MNSIHLIDSSGPTDAAIGWKKGVRALGVAESFEKSKPRSIMAGVVMRGDLRIDGFGVCTPQIGGKDSTKELVSMFERMKRKDIRVWLLGGSVISWFNIIDIETLQELTNTPVICVSYHPSEGIEKYLKEYFPDDWKARYGIVERTGPRKEVHLSSGHTLYLTTAGIGKTRAKNLVDRITIDGRVPEPIRVARTIAAGLHRDVSSIISIQS